MQLTPDLSESPARRPMPEELVDADILRIIEERYWCPIQETTTLEALLADDTFIFTERWMCATWRGGRHGWPVSSMVC